MLTLKCSVGKRAWAEISEVCVGKACFSWLMQTCYWPYALGLESHTTSVKFLVYTLEDPGFRFQVSTKAEPARNLQQEMGT